MALVQDCALSTEDAAQTRSDAMSITTTIKVELVPLGQYRASLPLGPSPSNVDEIPFTPRSEDRVLPLGSSTLSPGLRVVLPEPTRPFAIRLS